MARKLKSDKVLFTAMLALVCFSVVIVYSASAVVAMEKNNDPYIYLVKQAAWALMGLVLLPIVMKIDYRVYRQPTIVWTGLAVVTIALVAVLFSHPIKGASRWLGVGGFGVQPSEVAKIVVIIFMAWLLERRMDRVNEPSAALVPAALVLAVVVGLIYLEPDLGTSVSILVIASVMIFTAGVSLKYVGCLAGLAVPAFYVVVWLSDYRRRRVLSFLNPDLKPLSDGFQIVQSRIAVGTGGVFGRGFTAGVQKLGYLPEAHNDFIYAVIGEELGLIGATLVMACFCIIAWRGARTALRAPDRFGAFLAVGLTTMFSFQALFNISVVLGMAPTKGIPLPFVSYGGSSLLISLLGMAMLLNVSQHASTNHVVTMTLPPADE